MRGQTGGTDMFSTVNQRPSLGFRWWVCSGTATRRRPTSPGPWTSARRPSWPSTTRCSSATSPTAATYVSNMTFFVTFCRSQRNSVKQYLQNLFVIRVLSSDFCRSHFWIQETLFKLLDATHRNLMSLVTVDNIFRTFPLKLTTYENYCLNCFLKRSSSI